MLAGSVTAPATKTQACAFLPRRDQGGARGGFLEEVAPWSLSQRTSGGWSCTWACTDHRASGLRSASCSIPGAGCTRWAVWWGAGACPPQTWTSQLVPTGQGARSGHQGQRKPRRPAGPCRPLMLTRLTQQLALPPGILRLGWKLSSQPSLPQMTRVGRALSL